MNKFDFTQVYEEYKEAVWKQVSRYVAGKHDQEDLFQEVFIRIDKGLKGFRGGSDIKTWIYRIAANTAFSFLKKQKRYTVFKEMLNRLPIIEVEHDVLPEDTLLFKPLEKLNPQQRVILILADVEEHKLEDISEMLNLPLGTVKSNLSRARETIKKELSENGQL